jgi:carbon storage regulator
MLILSRKIEESIVIGTGKDAITVMVTRIEGGKVRLGIDAPKGVPVHREEVLQKMDAAKIKNNG